MLVLAFSFIAVSSVMIFLLCLAAIVKYYLKHRKNSPKSGQNDLDLPDSL